MSLCTIAWRSSQGVAQLWDSGQWSGPGYCPLLPGEEARSLRGRYREGVRFLQLGFDTKLKQIP